MEQVEGHGEELSEPRAGERYRKAPDLDRPDPGSANWGVKVSGANVGAAWWCGLAAGEVNQSERADASGSVELWNVLDPAKWVGEQHGCIYI